MDETLAFLFFQLTDSDTVLILNIIHIITIVDADKKNEIAVIAFMKFLIHLKC